MLIKLQNDWFDGQNFHKKLVTTEYNGPKELLPSSAVILSEDGTLPVGDNTPKPGFGAKPVEEQILDMLGAGPTHQIETSAGGALPSVRLTQEELDKRSDEARQAADDAANSSNERREELVKKMQQETAEALPKAHEAAERVEKAIDPLADIFSKGDAPKEDKPKAPAKK